MAYHQINRSLIIHNDFALGSGTVEQTRGEVTASEQKVELAFIFRTTDEIRYLDITRYTRVDLHTDGAVIHYWYDSTSVAVDDDNTVLAPIPAVANGRWLKVSGSGLGIANYNTIADLRADLAVVSSLTPYTQATVNGYYVPGDTGGGVFFWDPASTDPDDGGMTILPTGHIDPGRWKRVVENTVSVHSFGAKGDGITDDSIAFENCLLSVSAAGLIVTLNDLDYEVPGLNVTVPNRLRIIGTGNPLLYNGDTITCTSDYVDFRYVSLVGWTGGIQLDPTSIPYYNFDNFSAVGCAFGLFSPNWTYTVQTLRIRGGFFSGATMKKGIYFAGPVEFADVMNVKLDGLGDTAGSTYGIAMGISQTGSRTINVRNCECRNITGGNDQACHAIHIVGDQVVIEGNIITNILGTGTDKEAIKVSSTNCVVANNSITNGGEGGTGWISCIFGNNPKDRVIANNVLTGDSGIAGKGIYLSGTGSIIGNRINGDALTGGITTLGFLNLQQFIISDNYINAPAAPIGIEITDMLDSFIDNNHIAVAGSSIQTNAPVTSAFDIENTLITNNYFNAGTGLTVLNTKDVRIDGNTFVTPTAEIAGIYTAGWAFVDGIMATASANLASVTDVVNTMAFKRPGLMVWDTTLNKPVWSVGVNDNSVWVDATGATVHTPV